MCQLMSPGLCTEYEFYADLQRFMHGQNKSRIFENIVRSYFQQMRPNCRSESFYITGSQKMLDCFKAHAFCGHCNTVFERLGCFYHYCSYQAARLALTEEDIQRGRKNRDLDEMREQ